MTTKQLIKSLESDITKLNSVPEEKYYQDKKYRGDGCGCKMYHIKDSADDCDYPDYDRNWSDMFGYIHGDENHIKIICRKKSWKPTDFTRAGCQQRIRNVIKMLRDGNK